jgi:hypothetical protein
MVKHKGPVAYSTESGVPGHFAVGEDGPDFSKRVKWVEADPDNDDDTGGHWEEEDISREELEAAIAAQEQRLVNLKAQTKGTGRASGGE